MQIIAKRTLQQFWTKHKEAKTPLTVWHKRVSEVTWKGPADVKAEYGTTVDFIGDNRIIFDIGGNKFRLIVRVVYLYKVVQIKFVGTHKDYDKIEDPEKI